MRACETAEERTVLCATLVRMHEGGKIFPDLCIKSCLRSWTQRHNQGAVAESARLLVGIHVVIQSLLWYLIRWRAGNSCCEHWGPEDKHIPKHWSNHSELQEDLTPCKAGV